MYGSKDLLLVFVKYTYSRPTYLLMSKHQIESRLVGNFSAAKVHYLKRAPLQQGTSEWRIRININRFTPS